MRFPICRVMDRLRDSCSYFVIILWILLFLSSPSMTAKIIDYQLEYQSFADVPNAWRNTPISPLYIYEANSMRPILINGKFCAGFHCGFVGDGCLFAVSIFKGGVDLFAKQIVWSANRNNPVKAGALLQLTAANLSLVDGSGALVWSPNTQGKSVTVSRLNLSAEGNLMLFDKANNLLWQSFDHPTDSLVVGQRLGKGHKLQSSVSTSNSSDGFHTLSPSPDDDRYNFKAYLEADPSFVYYPVYGWNGRIEGIPHAGFHWDGVDMPGRFNIANSTDFMQLGVDGRLMAYEWKESKWEWEGVDLFGIDRCDIPMSCGNYGICVQGGCSCPDRVYFKQINSTQVDLGCSALLPLSCEHAHHQTLLQLHGMDLANSFIFTSNNTNITSLEDCKQACLINCSCKAAFFTTPSTFSTNCYLSSHVFSFKVLNTSDIISSYNYNNISIFVKVQNSSTQGQRGHIPLILGSSFGAIFGMLLICTSLFLLIRKTYKKVEEDYLDHISGMPERFSFEDLKIITNNFGTKLGEGGFGSVFHGTLPSGCDEVAVKHLDGLGQVYKSFIAEVQTIGSIHHFHLVTLVGFCAEKNNRLLVYQYMPNGSLDRWIFNKNQVQALGWQIRKNIILDIAKGLAYLHEECNQKIIHLDIKPQNILLDENFNAKISDFGLSKLVGRDQSQVITTMRGTPGYMAPEWLSSVITEKVDVYSFGIVVLEILCGRRNVDGSQPEDDRHLLRLFRRKQEEGQLQDLVDKGSDDMQSNVAEVVEMMKVAAWCLQSEYTRRPNMSTVVKIFESSTDVVGNLKYDFLNDIIPKSEQTSASAISPSLLSGPR